MRRIKIMGLAIGAGLAVLATMAGTASAAKLTLNEGGVALPVGTTFEAFGHDNVLIQTSAGNIECTQNMGFEEGNGGLSLEVLTNSKATDELRVTNSTGMLNQNPPCRSEFRGFGRASGRAGVVLEQSGVLKLRADGKATEGPVVVALGFEFGGECALQSTSLVGGNTAAPTDGPLVIGFAGQKLHLDKSLFNSTGCPKEATITVNLPSTEDFDEELERIEAETGTPPPAITGVTPDEGPKAGGTSVHITGANFIGATAVKFGSRSATSFKVRSAGSITAVSPPGVGQVDVTVTTPKGTSPINLADQFSYGPIITSVSPTGGPTGGGTSVTIIGAGLSGTTGVQFGSTNATSFTVDSANSLTAVSPPGAGAVDVTATTAEGPSPTSPADQFSYVPAPIVTGVSPSDGPEGGGTNVSISGTDLSGATAVKFGTTDASSFTVQSSSSITAIAPSGTGDVDVTVTTLGGTSSTGPADEFDYLAPPTVTNVNPMSGLAEGGTPVKLTGTNFTDVKSVAFGAIPATSFSVESATSLTALAPPGVGSVDVTVGTPGGTSAITSADTFSYLPRPTVTSVSPGTGPVAGGTVVKIKGTELTEATSVKFGATEAASFSVTSGSAITATSPTELAGTVDVTVTTPKGTSEVSPKDQFRFTPTVASVSPSSGPTTGGTSVTVTGSGFALGTAGTVVKFGAAKSSSVNCTSETECTALAPAHAAGTATVNNVTSAKNPPADQFSYE
jgi:hypothetical protein